MNGYRAELLSLPHDPREAGDAARIHHPDGLLVVEDGLIVAAGPFEAVAPRFPGLAVQHFPGKLIVPGFVDTHTHYPQIDRIASYGHQLLDWLEQHIFPAEAAFSAPLHARDVADGFLEELLRNGTTTALVFATVHEGSVDALFEAALAREMRIISGKVLMDLGPEELRDADGHGRAETEALIARWRGRGRLGYAITPRFALTSSDAQLQMAGELMAVHPDALLHTHLAENLAEVAAVAQRFGDSPDYLGVYERFGLVGPRSVFAHCIHLEPAALARMATARAGASLCPTSNLFLGSGLFDLARLDAAGVRVGFGTDVGAGTSFSMLATLREAYKVCQLRSCALDPFRALHLATAGGAAILGLGDRIGALEPGMEADFLVLDPATTPLLARRTAGKGLAERLFALQMLGDDRAIHATYVAGRLAHGGPAV
ncbi:guanine deaminase [Phenylobacterium sp. LjRoot225]|uniref:guanine deaminase n=1 Tax=Phenylobacterium sp. LjRoot225 TaxID=3342285 RepID=UPI003ECEA619